MTMYGDFDESYRPKAAPWRIAVAGFCQFVIAVWLTNALVSLADAYVLHRADVKDVFVVETVPWTTFKHDVARSFLVRGATNDLALRYEREFKRVQWFVAGGLLVLAIVVGFFWPTRMTLARRMFLLTLAQVLVAFGSSTFLVRESVTRVTMRPPAAAFALAGLGMALIFSAELRAMDLFNNVYPLRTPAKRIAYWSLRLLPGLLAVGAASYVAQYRPGVVAAGVLLVMTFFANLPLRPKEKYEQIEEIELREATAALLFITVVLLAGAFWAFRLQAPRRALLLADRQARLITIEQVPRELLARWKPPAPPQPKIDIRWARPRKK